MKYNQNPDLPSLEGMQKRVKILAAGPLVGGYKCYTGHILTDNEAESLNRYTVDALSPTIYNDQRALNDMLDRRHQAFVMIAECWVYVVGLGRYAHPEEAVGFKGVSQCTA